MIVLSVASQFVRWCGDAPVWVAQRCNRCIADFESCALAESATLTQRTPCRVQLGDTAHSRATSFGQIKALPVLRKTRVGLSIAGSLIGFVVTNNAERSHFNKPARDSTLRVIGCAAAVDQHHHAAGSIRRRAGIDPGRKIHALTTLELIGSIPHRRDSSPGRCRPTDRNLRDFENGSRIERIGSSQKLVQVRHAVGVRVVRAARVVTRLAGGMIEVGRDATNRECRRCHYRRQQSCAPARRKRGRCPPPKQNTCSWELVTALVNTRLKGRFWPPAAT